MKISWLPFISRLSQRLFRDVFTVVKIASEIIIEKLEVSPVKNPILTGLH